MCICWLGVERVLFPVPERVRWVISCVLWCIIGKVDRFFVFDDANMGSDFVEGGRAFMLVRRSMMRVMKSLLVWPRM